MGGALLAGGSLLAGKIRHRRRDSLPSYLRYYLGERLYRESGLQSYIQRFFSADDSQVDLAFARQRLGSIAEECSIRGNALRIVRELLASSASPPPWNCHVRPPGGFDVVYGEIASVLDRSGVVIRTGSPIGAISRCNGGFVITTADDEHHVDRIVSSVPLGAIACALSIPIRREPEFVTLFSLYYRFTGDPGYAAPYLYNFTHDGVWKRITLFSSYYGTAAGDHYYVVECTGRSGAEERLEILAGEFQRQMGSLPFFDGALTYVGGSVTPNAYPMSRRDGGRDLEDLRRAVLAAGIEVVGRQGRFEHTSSHAVATDSRAVATRVMQEGGNAA
jgi:hypothetical protein